MRGKPRSLAAGAIAAAGAICVAAGAILAAAGCEGLRPDAREAVDPMKDSADGHLVLHLRRRAPDPVEETVRWDPRRTALIICDMWDRHWCKGAEARVGELAKPMHQLIEALRARGVLIVHAPSTATGPYEGTPARRRAREAPMAPAPVPLSASQRWGTAWCWPDERREPALPIDDSDMGCDCPTKCEIASPWTRQIDAIRIDDADAVTDDGQETWNLLRSHGIEHALILGVHLNMCVLGRPFAIRQLVYLGADVVLVRDMTDTMYDPRMRPFVDHFRGTDLVVGHIERYWCPTVSSSDLTGKPPFRFRADRGGAAPAGAAPLQR